MEMIAYDSVRKVAATFFFWHGFVCDSTQIIQRKETVPHKGW